MKYKYIVSSDLDGTLLARGEKISPENASAIAEMKELGICFAPNSGRTIGEMPEAVLKNPDIRYYIGADGSAIWDKETDELFELAMSAEEARPVLDILWSYDTVNTVRSKGRSYVDTHKCSEEIFCAHRLGPLDLAFVEYYVNKVDNFKEFVRGLDSIGMIASYFLSDEDMNECRERIEALGDYKVASSAPKNIEIFHKRAGKGNGLLALADMLGVPRDNTVAVGDSKNDLDMLEKAGVSLAMGNGTEEVMAAAHRTICRCEDHSARYILENVIGKE